MPLLQKEGSQLFGKEVKELQFHQALSPLNRLS